MTTHTQPNQDVHALVLAPLRGVPRYTPIQTELLGRPIHVPDSVSFVGMYREIFQQQIYRFRPVSAAPRIIDGGANVGVSVIYFKHTYPDSSITAFEADPAIFAVLQQNVGAFRFSGVQLINAALWDGEGTLAFVGDGADAGRVESPLGQPQAKPPSGDSAVTVSTTRLRPYLQDPVDFLKLDIEGAETQVLEDCRDLLGNVHNLFVEYHSFRDRPQTLHRVLTLLHRAGFRVHVHPVCTSPNPLLTLKDHMGMDLQLNLFGVRDG